MKFLEPGNEPAANDSCDYYYSMFFDRKCCSFTDCTAEEHAVLYRIPGTAPPSPKIKQKYKPGSSRVRTMQYEGFRIQYVQYVFLFCRLPSAFSHCNTDRARANCVNSMSPCLKLSENKFMALK